MKITAMINAKGNTVKNQFIVTTSKGMYLQSYNTVVAFIPKRGKPQLSKAWDFSQTTLRNVKLFLNISESKAQIKKDINNKMYTLKDCIIIR